MNNQIERLCYDIRYGYNKDLKMTKGTMLACIKREVELAFQFSLLDEDDKNLIYKLNYLSMKNTKTELQQALQQIIRINSK